MRASSGGVLQAITEQPIYTRWGQSPNALAVPAPRVCVRIFESPSRCFGPTTTESEFLGVLHHGACVSYAWLAEHLNRSPDLMITFFVSQLCLVYILYILYARVKIDGWLVKLLSATGAIIFSVIWSTYSFRAANSNSLTTSVISDDSKLFCW
jgi:hypothetical protein